ARRRAPPKINRDVEDLSRRHAHELALRAAELIVQAAQRMAHGSTVVVLHELPIEPVLDESALVPRLEEKAALVREDVGLDDQHVRYPGRRYFHVGGSSRWSSPRLILPSSAMARTPPIRQSGILRPNVSSSRPVASRPLSGRQAAADSASEPIGTIASSRSRSGRPTRRACPTAKRA